MDETRFDRSVKVLADATDRCDAVRSLGAAGMAVLAGLGLPGAASTVPGPIGDIGPTGPAGVPGLPCSPGTPVMRVGKSARGTPSNFVKSFASCGPGEHAVSGGYFFSSNQADPFPSWVSSTPGPLDDGRIPTGWVVEMILSPGGQFADMQAWALCVPD